MRAYKNCCFNCGAETRNSTSSKPIDVCWRCAKQKPISKEKQEEIDRELLFRK